MTSTKLMMRVLVFSLFVGVALAVPQGYNYQLNYASNNGEDLTYPQVQSLQQFASQQEQSVAQQQTVTITEAQASVQPQNIAPVGGSQFGNQLIQLASYGQQQQQVQQPQQLQVPLDQPELSLVQTQHFSQPIQPVPQPLAQPHVQPQLQYVQPVQQQPQILTQLQPHPEPQPQLQPQPQFQAQNQPQFFSLPQLQPQPQLLQQTQSEPQQQSVQYSSAPQHLPEPAQQHASSITRAPEFAYYNKEFYYLSAPQENYELPPDFNDQLNKFKKNLRIVFIKAPEQKGLEKAALQLVKDSQQPKTAIYVLTKQHSAAELAKKLQQQPASAQLKPEVIFIKYRTPQEAEHAQRTIQSLYESLNGPNHFNYEGVVPTHNFVGSTAAIEPRKRPAEESAVTNAATPSPLDYLPPAE